MRRPWRIGSRLLIAHTLVLVVAIGTAALVAALVGPPLFHEHMLRAGQSPDPSERMHVEEAYRAAGAISLGLAVTIALLIALAVSWYLTRRFQAPLTTLTHAATAVSGGRYDVSVPANGAGPEIDSLATAFNSMARQLSATEDTRRRLLSDLAHELRTPLATLTASLEGLEDGVIPWDSEARLLLEDQVSRLRYLADDINAVSRAEEGGLELEGTPVRATDLLETAVRSQRSSFEAKGVELALVPGPAVTVLADRSRLLQVLTNLLDNARRHTPTGGRVTIGWTRVGAELSISVSDSGDGITSAQLAHVFERFYRGDSARDREQQGSGIGLTISRGIAAAHGGHLDAHSDGLGTGATFTLTLPIRRTL